MSKEIERNLDIIFRSMDFLEQGLSIFDSELRLVVANQRFVEILDFPSHFKSPGTRLEDIFRFNAERGEYGPGDVEELVRDRIELALLFESHRFRRTRLDGAVIEVTGNPIPGGGFISTYQDVTREVDRSRQLEEELLAAQALQTRLLPSDDAIGRVESNCAVTIKALCRQAEEIGGDIWGLSEVEDGKFAFFVVDNVGHGVVASLNAFRVHTIISQYLPQWESLDGWVSWVNDQMCEVLDVDQFAAYVFGTIDPKTRIMNYAAGGAPRFLLGRLGPEPAPVMVDTAGLLLGVLEGMEPLVKELDLPRDWVAVFYSDALTETEIALNNFLGEDELKSIFQQGCVRGSVSRVFETFNDVVETWFPMGMSDDLTLVCIGEKGTLAGDASAGADIGAGG